ncbi:MAG: hypothetical protein ACQEXJ_24040 [Myxococcota bacterium]
MRRRDVRVVAGFEIGRVLRSRHGLVFIGLLLLFVLAIALQLFEVADRAEGLGRKLNPAGEQMVFEIVSWWTELSPGIIQDLFDRHPPVLLALFAALLGITPMFTMLLSFDQTATDIQGRHARYLLVRTDRVSLFVGKALAAWLLLAASMAAAVGIIGGVLMTTPMGLGGVGGVLYLVRVWASVVFFALPFVALMSFTGAWLGRPFLALVSGFALQFVVWLGATLGALWDDSLESVRYAFPTAMKYHLVSDGAGDLLPAVAHQAGFAALLFAAGLLVFRRRDI